MLTRLAVSTLALTLLGGAVLLGAPPGPQGAELRVMPQQGLRSRGYLPEGPLLPREKEYIVDNLGDAPMDWRVATRADWVRLSSEGGTLGPGGRTSVLVTVDEERALRLGPGQHRAEVLFRTREAGTTTRTVGVQLTHPGLRARPVLEDVSFLGPPGGPFGPGRHAIELANADTGPLIWEATSDRPWITCSPAEGGLAPGQGGTLALGIDPELGALLPEGEHRARVDIVNGTDGVGGGAVDVVLTVRTPTRLAIEPEDTVRLAGRAGGEPDRRELVYSLTNRDSPHPLRWRAEPAAAWLVPDRETGELAPGESVRVQVSVDAARVRELSPGRHRGGVAFVNVDDGVGTLLAPVLLDLSAEDEQVDGATPEESLRVSSLSRFGITWTFDREVEAGQFAGGDWWVLGPVLVTGIDPPSREVRGRVTNGSMVNPDPLRGSAQGYDSATYHVYKTPRDWNPRLNVALNLSAKDPLLLAPHTTLVSSISREKAGERPQLRAASVLTVLDRRPPADAFRPPYVGDDKSIEFVAGQLDFSVLGRLEPLPFTPSFSEVEAWFERPWLDHVPDWGGRYIHPIDNMPEYGREMTDYVGIASLLLQLDHPDEEKRTLAIRLVQLGIDYFGIVEAGSTNHWPAGGGHHSGRKWPILMAGALLNDPDMLHIGFMDVAFNEDDQTFHVEETAPGVYNHGQGGYTAEHVGMAEWGTQHWKQLRRGQLPTLDDVGWFANDYRLCCTANVWWGELLAARIMGLREAWNHDALFDYQDRFLRENKKRGIADWRLAWSPFPVAMWRAYRADY